MITLNEKALHSQETRDYYRLLISGKSVDDALYSLELAERQKYNYYIDCSDRFSSEEDEKYHASWNEIIEMIKEVKALK